MPEYDRRTMLLGMLSDVHVEGLVASSMSLQELENLEVLHKKYNQEYNGAHKLSAGTTPDLAYIEKRNAYVNQRISEELTKQKRGLEAQLQNGK